MLGIPLHLTRAHRTRVLKRVRGRRLRSGDGSKNHEIPAGTVYGHTDRTTFLKLLSHTASATTKNVTVIFLDNPMNFNRIVSYSRTIYTPLFDS